MRVAILIALCATSAWANTCVLAAGTYATLASTSTHWTGAGCTGAYVAGIGDTANLGTNSAVLTVALGETWTIGTSPATGTAVLIMGGGGLLHIAGTVRVRGDTTSGAGATTVIDVQAGGSFIFDATQNLAAFYEYNPTGSRIFQAVGTSGSCTYTNGYSYTGATCATVTSDLTGGAAPGDFTGGHTGGFTTDYAAFSNLGTASRTAIYLGAFNFNTVTPATFHHTSIVNSGLIITDSYVNISWTNFAVNGGLNTQDSSEDIEIFDTSNSVTRTLTDFAIGRGAKFLSPLVWTISRGVLPGAFIWSTATGATASTCSEIMMPTAGADINFPCSLSYLLLIRNQTSTTGHLLAVPGVGTAGTTVNISKLYCEFPDADSGANQGKCLITNGANPSVATQTNVTNAVLTCDKTGVGNSEIVGGSGTLSTANNLLTITHATACVQSGAGGSQWAFIDEGGAADNTLNFEANIMYAPAAAFYKSLSGNVAAPSTNVIKTADYNAAGSAFTAANAGCPNCTINGGSAGGANGWTHKCVTAAGVTCPSGVHDVGPTTPGFSNTNFRWATWATLGTPAQLRCADWVTSTLYTYDPLNPTCVSVTNAGVYGSVAINYILTTTHTSAPLTKPDSGANWRNDWKYQTDHLMNIASVSGTTYSGVTPAVAFWTWVGTGMTPTASSYRFTFPGDTNAVTNVGAFQMGPSGSARHRSIMQ